MRKRGILVHQLCECVTLSLTDSVHICVWSASMGSCFQLDVWVLDASEPNKGISCQFMNKNKNSFQIRSTYTNCLWPIHLRHFTKCMRSTHGRCLLCAEWKLTIMAVVMHNAWIRLFDTRPDAHEKEFYVCLSVFLSPISKSKVFGELLNQIIHHDFCVFWIVCTLWITRNATAYGVRCEPFFHLFSAYIVYVSISILEAEVTRLPLWVKQLTRVREGSKQNWFHQAQHFLWWTWKPSKWVNEMEGGAE